MDRALRLGRAGRVTSTRSKASRAFSARFAEAALRAAIASPRGRAAIESAGLFRALVGLMPPSVFSSSLISPFLPSAATRTASSAASSPRIGDGVENWRSRIDIDIAHADGPNRKQAGGISGPGGRFTWVDRLGFGHDNGIETRLTQPCLIHQSLEGLGLVHGEIGEDLAVDLDPGPDEPADKSAVGEAIKPAGRVDALDPEGAEIPLLLFAADIIVLQRAVDRGVGRGDRVLAAAVEALGLLEDALAAGMARVRNGGRVTWFSPPQP
jgi:hypothetical protein